MFPADEAPLSFVCLGEGQASVLDNTEKKFVRCLLGVYLSHASAADESVLLFEDVLSIASSR